MTQLLVLLVLLVAGCTSLYDAPPQSVGRMDIGRDWPQPTPSPFGLRSGGRVHTPADERIARAPSASLDEYLKPEFRAQAPTPLAPSQRVPARALDTRASPTATASAETSSTQAAPVLVASNTRTDSERYAHREKKAASQQQFRGGDAIIIGTGTVLLILLVVVLVLLLT